MAESRRGQVADARWWRAAESSWQSAVFVSYAAAVQLQSFPGRTLCKVARTRAGRGAQTAGPDLMGPDEVVVDAAGSGSKGLEM